MRGRQDRSFQAGGSIPADDKFFLEFFVHQSCFAILKLLFAPFVACSSQKEAWTRVKILFR